MGGKKFAGLFPGLSLKIMSSLYLKTIRCRKLMHGRHWLGGVGVQCHSVALI